MGLFTDGFIGLKKGDKPLYKTPKSVQQQIEILRIAKDGIFENTKNKYSKAYRFRDINYVTVSEQDQYEILKQYCKLVNAIDVSFKLTIYNKNKDMGQFRRNVLLADKDDGYDYLRDVYNDIVEERIVAGKQGIEQERLLTVTVERKDYEQAKAFYNTFEGGMQQEFQEIGSKLEPLDAEERLRVLYHFYRIGEEEDFVFDFDEYVKSKQDYKNDICGSMIKFSANDFETDRKVCRAVFIRRFPTSLPDTFINELTNVPIHSITSIDIVPVPKDLTTKTLQKKYLGVESDILKQQRVRNKNNDFSSEISYGKKVEKKTLEGIMDDVRENDQNLFFAGVNMVLIADNREELNSITETIQTIGNKHLCSLEVHHLQQREALNTALPVGVRQVETMRTMLTRDIAALMPFNVQEINQLSGLCYGLNGISKNLCIANRKKLTNGNAMVFGVPGSGKSFFCKAEMLGVFLKTDDEILVIDPTLEYFDIARNLGGACINLSNYTQNFINPLWLDVDQLDVADSKGLIRDKGEFMLGLCEQAMAELLNSRHKSIIDRCIRKLYLDIAMAKDKYVPVMSDFYDLLMKQPEEEARDIALGLELFVNGSLNIFNHQTNIDVDNRFIVYGIRDLGKELSAIAMLVMLENVSARIARNAEMGRATWLYIDECHVLLGTGEHSGHSEYAGKFLYSLWKKVRKQGGLCTAITQNITDMLQNYTAVTMLANSEFIALLKQANVDSQELSRVAGIPEAQLKFVSNCSSGMGVLKHGETIIPFDGRVNKKNNVIYDLFNTNLHEKMQTGKVGV
ncbi:VirB4-like conjugal transfer ATPase, CD1110 family [[Clostridium] symbiosum]|uniref:VirB4-like conjugal transfer ATPase, CD1110 family n=1 Tax=Clostridium symbiosum TaxID=1512 RepID=UPI001AA11F88|nr:hypothetical protein [[Clostridium] symbiosum]